MVYFKGDAQNLRQDVRFNIGQVVFDVVDDNETFVNIGDEYVKDTDRLLLKIKINNIMEHEQTKLVDYQFQLDWKTDVQSIQPLPAC